MELSAAVGYTTGFNLTWDYLPLGDGLTVMLPFDKDDATASPPEV
jgi:hypothetical protein